MNMGFVISARAHEVAVATYPATGRAAALVSFAQEASGLAVFLGRLHYRDELCAALADRLSETDRINDAALALALYRHHGDAGLERLEGDFALALWDARSGRLVGCRDPLGGYPLYWAAHGDTLTLATGVQPLLDRLGRRDLDLDYLADFLMVRGQRNEGPGEACAYQGVHRVLPGAQVAGSFRGVRVERRPARPWTERIVDPGCTSVAGAAERLAPVLRGAVRERLGRVTASDCSGGIDSTGVTRLAGQMAPVHAFALVFERLPKLARETPYVEAALRDAPGLTPQRIVADDLLDFGDVAAPRDEPDAGVWRLGLDRAKIEAAAALGADTLLTGVGADDLFEVNPFHLADLLRAWQVWGAWREAGRWAGAYNCSPWQLLGMFGREPLWPGAGQPVPAWLRPEFVRRHRLRDRARANARRPYGHHRRTRLSMTLEALTVRAGDPVRWAVAAPLGLSLAHPFLDPRVIGLALGIQLRVPPEPGPMKPVLTHALRDVLPPQVTQRRAKGSFDEVFFLGLRRHLPALEALIRETPLDDLGVLDRAALVRGLEVASLGGATAPQLQGLCLSLAAVGWLAGQRRAETAPPQWYRCRRGPGLAAREVAAVPTPQLQGDDR